MNNTYDAMDALKRSIENLEGCVPSATGTPISRKSYKGLFYGNSAGGDMHPPTLPARKQTEHMNTASGQFKRTSMHDINSPTQDLFIKLCVGVLCVSVVVLGLILVDPIGWFL